MVTRGKVCAHGARWVLAAAISVTVIAGPYRSPPVRAAGTDPVVARIVLGGGIAAVAVDTIRHLTAAISNESDMQGRLIIFDTANGHIVHSIDMHLAGHDVQVGEHSGLVYVAHLFVPPYRMGGGLSIYDIRTGALIHRVRLPDSPFTIAVDEQTNRLFIPTSTLIYATDGGGSSGHIRMLDAVTGKEIRVLPSGSTPVIDHTTGQVLLMIGPHTLGRFDGRTGDLLHRYTLPDHEIGAYALNSRVGQLYVASPGRHVEPQSQDECGPAPCRYIVGDGSLTILDARTGDALRTFPEAVADPGQVLLDSGAGRAFISGVTPRDAPNTGEAILTVLDTASGGVLRTIWIDNLAAIALDQADGRLLVAGYHGGVAVFDAVSGATLGLGAAPDEPDGIIVDAVTARALVFNGAHGGGVGIDTITVLDAAFRGPPRSTNACTGARTAANAVVHFYLALDQGQFAAAYNCLDPAFRGSGSLATFSHGYATTITDRLLLADQQPDGSVRIDLHATDAQPSGLVVTTFTGQWGVGISNALAHPASQVVRREDVSRVPSISEADIFAYDHQQVRRTAVGGVTGDGQDDYLFLTDGPEGRQAWVFSQDRLVFAAPAKAAIAIRPAANRHGFTLVFSKGNVQSWRWTSFGFIQT